MTGTSRRKKQNVALKESFAKNEYIESSFMKTEN